MAVKAWSPKHWTAREFPKKIFFTEEYWLINIEEMIELEKYSLAIPSDRFRKKIINGF